MEMLAELRAALAGIEEAILVLECIAAGSGKRRGRPPRWLEEMRGGDARKSVDEAGQRKRRRSGEAGSSHNAELSVDEVPRTPALVHSGTGKT